MVRRSAAFASALALALLAPASASAQGETGADRDTHFVSIDAATARYAYPGGRTSDGRAFPASSMAVLTSGVSARLRPIGPPRGGRGFLLDVELSMRGVLGESSSIGEWILHPGHGEIGLMVGGRFREAVARGGIVATLPFGMLGARPNEAAPLTSGAQGALGGWDVWTLWRDAFAFVLRGDVAFRHDWLALGIEWAVGPGVSLNSQLGSVGSWPMMQVGGWAAAEIANVELGVRATAIVLSFAPYAGALGFARLRADWLSVEARGGVFTHVVGELHPVALVVVAAAVP